MPTPTQRATQTKELSTAPDQVAPTDVIEAPQDWAAIAQTWQTSIQEAEKLLVDFRKRGDRVTKRYRAEVENEGVTTKTSKFNIFWSNVQTLAPATYSRRPKVDVSRRFRDADPVGRLAGMILERAIQYEVDCSLDFHHTMQAVVLDRLLPGQGCAWVRYDPTFAQETQDVPDPENPLSTKSETIEVLASERTATDYVYWKDFLASPARTWADNRWVGRRVMFGKDALAKRFKDTLAKMGGKIEDVPCNYDPALQSGTNTDNRNPTSAARMQMEGDSTLKRAIVWEIWDKETFKVYWIVIGFALPLDIVDDPAHLENFWPCPRPAWATTTNDTLIPIPDYLIYRSQLQELDEVTQRISLLTSALRVIGVYDASQASLQTLLASGVENRMVPVNQWGAFAEKGGLKGTMDFLPIDQIVKVLEGLYKSREALKQTIYEITGMADIVRGASVASETLGAQQIKAKFANLRLSSRQQQISEFCTEILQIKGQIMCNQYSPETLVKISSAEQIPEIAEELAATPPQPGVPPDPMQSKKLQAALALLKNDKLRQYRIEIQADSMIELDEVDERERRNEFMSSVSNFMLAVKNISAIAPEMMPVALEMLKFVVRGFSVGRTLESKIDDAADAVLKRIKNPPPQPPSPEQIKMQIAKMAEDAENMRTRFKEDAATDREELKATVTLVTTGMQQQLDQLMQMMQQLDMQSDADAQQDAQQIGLVPPPAQPQPPQPPQGMPQGASQ